MHMNGLYRNISLAPLKTELTISTKQQCVNHQIYYYSGDGKQCVFEGIK